MILSSIIELEMLKNLPVDYQFSTFETVLGLYVRVNLKYKFLVPNQ